MGGTTVVIHQMDEEYERGRGLTQINADIDAFHHLRASAVGSPVFFLCGFATLRDSLSLFADPGGARFARPTLLR
jgi:hypothetical protein